MVAMCILWSSKEDGAMTRTEAIKAVQAYEAMYGNVPATLEHLKYQRRVVRDAQARYERELVDYHRPEYAAHLGATRTETGLAAQIAGCKDQDHGLTAAILLLSNGIARTGELA